ncbi:MAG: ADOP family duplicated permease [Acidobacteriota bacterium]
MTDRFVKRLGRNVERPLGRDVDDEITFHLEMRQRELEVQGMSPEDAREEAARLFGNRKTISAQSRRQTRAARRAKHRGWQMTRLFQDLRFAFRKLAHEPGFTAAAILTLALGIGANTAVFSVLDAVLLRPLGFPDSERLVALWEINDAGNEIAVGHDNFLDWREQSSTFESMALFGNRGGTITGEFDALTASGASVSRGFFTTLGIGPHRGRFLGPDDHQLGAPPVIVLSEGLWQGSFGGVPLEDLVLQMDEESYQVVGIVASGEEFPEGAQYWMAHERVEDFSHRTAHNYRVVARLPQGESLSTALEASGAEMTTIAQRLAIEYEGENDAVDVAVRPWHEEIVAGSRRPLWLLLAAAGLLLIVACANLAGSLLARSFSRQREMAVRAAIGAGQGGLLQQLLVESLVLAALGGLAGAALAATFVRLLLAAAPPGLPRLGDVGIDPRVLFFTFAVSTLAGVALGLVPGWSILRAPLRSALAGSATAGRKHRLWNLLIGTEVALALVLLVGAGLLLGSVRKIVTTPLGFEPEGVLTAWAELPVPLPDYGPDLEPLLAAEQDLGAFAYRFLDDVAALPGVEQVALASTLPAAGLATTTVYLDDRPDDEAGVAGYVVVSEDYFETLQVPLLEGRTFTPSDVTQSEHVAVISKAMAQRYWPDKSALGQRIRPPGMDLHGETWLRVVGVVDDVRQRGATRASPSLMYVSLRQRPVRAKWSALVLRTQGAPETLSEPLRDAAGELSKDMPLRIVSFVEMLRSSISRQRFQMMLMTIFAAIGLLLAAGGIWAVVAFQVAERHTELGIRMALGAPPNQLIAQVVRGTILVVGAGCVLGLAASVALSRSLASLLFEIEPNEPSVLAAMAAIILVTGVVASVIPALRTARVDPSTSLRSS